MSKEVLTFSSTSRYPLDPEDVTSQEHETNTEQVLHITFNKTNTKNFTQLYKNNNPKQQ